MTRDELAKQCVIEVHRLGGEIWMVVTHAPTGMVERESNVKSQHKARENCFWRLGQRLALTVAPEQP